jgi:hypothetical protein
VIARLITTTIIGVMLVIMMDKGCLAADRASRIVQHNSEIRPFRCELMIAITALVFLITVFIFAVTIKFMRIVALRTS